jgi:hypothetical protein
MAKIRRVLLERQIAFDEAMQIKGSVEFWKKEVLEDIAPAKKRRWRQLKRNEVCFFILSIWGFSKTSSIADVVLQQQRAARRAIMASVDEESRLEEQQPTSVSAPSGDVEPYQLNEPEINEPELKESELKESELKESEHHQAPDPHEQESNQPASQNPAPNEARTPRLD